MKRIACFDALSTLEADGGIEVSGARGAKFITLLAAPGADVEQAEKDDA